MWVWIKTPRFTLAALSLGSKRRAVLLNIRLLLNIKKS
jgi:hypothetical protein